MTTELIHVKGLAELQRKFARVSTELGRKILRAGCAAGAQVVKSATKDNVRRLPRKRDPGTGTLERAVIINYRKADSNDQQAVFVVTVRQGKRRQARTSKGGRKIKSTDAFYGRFVEFGHFTRPAGTHLTRKGKLVPNRVARTLVDRSNQERSGKIRRVPGYPFLGPALAGNKDRAIEAMADTVRARFDAIRP